jgi:hypothetical protein
MKMLKKFTCNNYWNVKATEFGTSRNPEDQIIEDLQITWIEDLVRDSEATVLTRWVRASG